MNNLNYIVKSKENIYLDINKILVNTYILLSMTLFFSAICAFVSIKFNVIKINFLFMLISYIVLLYLINLFQHNYLGIFFVFVFTGLIGYSIGPAINFFLSVKNGKNLILLSLFITGSVFLFLSLYVFFSKKNFDFLNGFLFIGSVFIILSILISFFIKFYLLDLVISGFIVIFSSAMILYETSRIINGGEKSYILATVSLYLQIYNLFISILSIFNFFSEKD